MTLPTPTPMKAQLTADMERVVAALRGGARLYWHRAVMGMPSYWEMRGPDLSWPENKVRKATANGLQKRGVLNFARRVNHLTSEYELQEHSNALPPSA